ncbi:MAG: hypothetical protein ACT4R6_09680, partial [Gemmatimonadaceae bacterium]
RGSAIASVVVLLGANTLGIGDTTSARVEVRNGAGALVTDRFVMWNTANSEVAWPTSQGHVTAVRPGLTEIIATVDSVRGSAPVSVVRTTELPPPDTTTAPPVDSAQSTVSAPAQLPRDSVDISWRAPTARSIVVRAGDNLQQAINSAQRGDEIVLEAGATFKGNFVLPAKSGSPANGWVLMRTAALSALPPRGTRIDADQHARYMAKLLTPNLREALRTAPGASGWRVVGIEMGVVPGVGQAPQIQQGIVLLGDGSDEQNRTNEIPTDIILDRVYVHGEPTTNTKRCVALNSAATAIVDSELLECHGRGFDSQAIAGWNGPGPYLIENNRLEGAGEVIIFGGGDPQISQLIPSDIVVRRNHIYRPMSWRGAWTVKALFELKNAQRVLLEGNVLENHWVDAQAGSAIVLGSVNQDGHCSWCVVQDVNVRYNHIHNVAAVFNVFARCGLASPGGPYGCDQGAQPTRRVAIRHNLFTGVGAPGLGAAGSIARVFLLQSDVHDLWIEHNTGFAPYSYLTFSGDGAHVKQRFTFRNNIGGASQYDWFSSQGQGNAATTSSLARPFVVQSNGFVGTTAATAPGGSRLVATVTDVGFLNPTWPEGNWSLRGTSPFAGMGVDFTALQVRIRGVAR